MTSTLPNLQPTSSNSRIISSPGSPIRSVPVPKGKRIPSEKRIQVEEQLNSMITQQYQQNVQSQPEESIGATIDSIITEKVSPQIKIMEVLDSVQNRVTPKRYRGDIFVPVITSVEQNSIENLAITTALNGTMSETELTELKKTIEVGKPIFEQKREKMGIIVTFMEEIEKAKEVFDTINFTGDLLSATVVGVPLGIVMIGFSQVVISCINMYSGSKKIQSLLNELVIIVPYIQALGQYLDSTQSQELLITSIKKGIYNLSIMMLKYSVKEHPSSMLENIKLKLNKIRGYYLHSVENANEIYDILTILTMNITLFFASKDESVHTEYISILTKYQNEIKAPNSNIISILDNQTSILVKNLSVEDRHKYGLILPTESDIASGHSIFSGGKKRKTKKSKNKRKRKSRR